MAMNHRLLRPRASGGGFDPRSISGLVGWWDAADATSVTLNGSSVSQLNDKSGSGFHATQGIASNQPLYVTNAINGRNVVRFSSVGGLHRLLLTGPSMTAGNSIVSVFTTGSGDSYLANYAAGSSNGPAIIHGYDAAGRVDWFTTTDRVEAIASSSGVQIFVFLVTSAGPIETFANGAAGGSKATGVSLTTFSLEKFGNSGRNAAPYDGDFCEYMHINRVITTGERNAIEQYLSHKWGKSLA